MRRLIACLTGAFFGVITFAQPTYFGDEQVKVVGEIHYGQTSDKIEYTDTPRYRAIYFEGQPGDKVDIKVTSINGQALAVLTDSRYKPIVSNFGSHVTTVLPPSSEPYPNRYFVLLQEERRRPGTFTVTLDKTGTNRAAASADYLTCSDDAECIAVPKAGCCGNGYKEAVNKNRVDSYRAANTCKIAHPVCPQVIIDDNRVAHCNRTSHQCELVQPSASPQ